MRYRKERKQREEREETEIEKGKEKGRRDERFVETVSTHTHTHGNTNTNTIYESLGK